jgi:hypothetical protein
MRKAVSPPLSYEQVGLGATNGELNNPVYSPWQFLYENYRFQIRVIHPCLPPILA